MEPLGKAVYKMGLRNRKGPFHFFPACPGISVAQIVRDGAGKQPGLLGDVGDAAAQLLLGQLCKGNASEQDPSLSRVKKP